MMNISVIVPLMNEEASIVTTVETLVETAGDDIGEILIVTCERTTAGCLAVAERLRDRFPEKIRVLRQRLPNLGGALRTGIEQAHGSHVVTMFSDLESDPTVVAEFAAVARTHPDTVVSASRWLETARFVGYGRKKLVLNWLFQKGCKVLFQTKVTDFTFGFRMYPRDLLRRTRFAETGHAFVLESILKPVRLGARIIEVPCVWRGRREGESHVTFALYGRYVALVLATRLVVNPKQWLITSQEAHRRGDTARRDAKNAASGLSGRT